ncbi:GntR family transcriptional regulator [Verrucosispora sp. NA02020]|nr:GntR family transcriptional regulator [Verrucosispora sp. NA02020]
MADELRERIQSGVIPPGALLPTESTLCAEFRASRGTIRHALAALREEGLAVTDHGRGTYASIHVWGSSGQSRTALRTVLADSRLAALLGVTLGEQVTEQETAIEENGRVSSVVRVYRKPVRSADKQSK